MYTVSFFLSFCADVSKMGHGVILTVAFQKQMKEVKLFLHLIFIK